MQTLALALLIFVMAGVTNALTIWTDWTDRTVGDAGSATGKLGSITVNYSGEVSGSININGTTNLWHPDTTYIGGFPVGSASVPVPGAIGLLGSGLAGIRIRRKKK